MHIKAKLKTLKFFVIFNFLSSDGRNFPDVVNIFSISIVVNKCKPVVKILHNGCMGVVYSWKIGNSFGKYLGRGSFERVLNEILW